MTQDIDMPVYVPLLQAQIIAVLRTSIEHDSCRTKIMSLCPLGLNGFAITI